MALKIDITHGFNWPVKLARTLDVDGAFRRAACLAVARVCEIKRGWDPGCYAVTTESPGGGRVDVNKKGYIEQAIERAAGAASLTSLDSYTAMFGGFLWDGGTEEIVPDESEEASLANETPSDEGSEEKLLVTVTSGEDLFQDVLARLNKKVTVTDMDQEERVEALAYAGAPSCGFASRFPYRMWWDAFNRAVYALVRDIVYEGHVGFAEQLPDTQPTDVYSYTVLPLCLTAVPSGVKALGPDDLLVSPTPEDEAKVLEVVPSGVHWLLTPNDVDFGTGWFGYIPQGRRGNLRDIWVQFAHAVGFDAFEQRATDLPRPKFRDGYKSWWHGRTDPRFSKTHNRLYQLGSDWSGDHLAWRDEFPYHGFAAQVAALDYLETSSVGFAVLDNDEQVPVISHDVRTFHKLLLSEVDITAVTSPTRVTPDSWAADTTEETNGYSRPAMASRMCEVDSSADVSVTSDFTWTVLNVTHYESATVQWSASGDSGGFLEEYATQGPLALAVRLNQLWNASHTSWAVRFSFTSTYVETRPYGDLSSPVLPPARLCLDGDYPVVSGSFPHPGRDWTGDMYQNLSVYTFLKSSYSSAILKGAVDADEFLSSELTCEKYESADELPGPGSETPYVDIEPLDYEVFSVEQTEEQIEIGGTHTVPMFIVRFQGRQVFPPVDDGATPPESYRRDLGDVTIGGLVAKPAFTYTDPNDYSDVECSSSNYLEVLRAIHFIKYPRNAIYPI